MFTLFSRVVGRAARRSCLPGLLRGSGGRQAGTRVLSCLAWPDKCVQRRSMSGGEGTVSATAGRTPAQNALVGRLSRLVVSGVVV